MKWQSQVAFAVLVFAVFFLSRYLLVDQSDAMGRGTHFTVAIVAYWVSMALFSWFGSPRRREDEWLEASSASYEVSGRAKGTRQP